MPALVPLAIFGWPLVVLMLFTVVSARRAVVVAMLGAWLFLPMAGYSVSGLPDITKMSVTSVSVLLGVCLFDPSRFAFVRLGLADIAIAAWIAVPLPSAISAGQGLYEGVTGVVNAIVWWGLPYFIGRLYFCNLEGLGELAAGIFVGGLVYMPLVLFEARMSPQLHTIVYGFHQHSFDQARRMGGWRPTVFMQHGLAVALFMGAAALCGVWLTFGGKLRRIAGLPAAWVAVVLVVVSLLCRSAYASVLTLGGLGVLFGGRLLSSRVPLLCLIVAAPAYVLLRTVGGWDAGLLRAAAALFGEDRVGSLAVRLDSEDSMWRWIQGSLVFGRGRLTELMMADKDAWGLFIPDGLWLIALGKNGMFGLLSLLGALLLPTLAYLNRAGPRVFRRQDAAGAAVMGVVLTLYALDNLLNAMVNPIYLLAAGGLAVCRVPRAGSAVVSVADRARSQSGTVNA